jgi:hypothetical protein
MKSVGEVMAIGRTFKESLQKALRSLEIGSCGLESRLFDLTEETRRALTAKEQSLLVEKLRVPNWERLWYLGDAFRSGMKVGEIHDITGIDPWFLNNIKQILEMEDELKSARHVFERKLPELGEIVKEAKQYGFSDKFIGRLWGTTEEEVRNTRTSLGIKPVFKRVDTCAAEFVAYTPYMYSTKKNARPTPATGARSSSSAADRTASARASSSTIAACTRRWRCARTATRPSWSTATRRRFPPTTTPPIDSISNPLPMRTSSI